MPKEPIKPKVDLGSEEIKVVVIGGSVVTCDNPRVEITTLASGLKDKKRR